ncbi:MULTISPECIES: replication initiation protein RepC [unclassified Sulfitobacter]|uniref:replication initiation protein RepC n=1 Tax=unclassified Sulfitobacter TaxID=196795 RepID=UPI003745CA28
MTRTNAMQAQDLTPDTSHLPVLPEGMERDGFIRLFRDVAKPMFGLTDAEITTFERLADDTRPSDWKRHDTEPCCWRRQGEVATRRAVSRFTIARHERALQQCGLIDKRTMAHGARSGYDGCGLFFSSAIALVPAMLHYKAQLEAEAAEHNLLCNTRSIHKGHCKAALAELRELMGDCDEVSRLTALFDAWPDARVLRRMDLEPLREHVEDADSLTREVLDKVQKTENLQHRCSTNATPYIQDTTQEITYVCNASVDKRSAGKPAHSDYSGSEPNGSEHCKEKEYEEASGGHNTEMRFKLTGRTLYNLCSNDMKLYVDAHRDPHREPTDHDFSYAVVQMLRELGISNSAWNDACNVMGFADAVLAVIITDANRFSPEIRVKCPGGYLRGMTSAARNGQLNLIGSLKALSQRTEPTHSARPQR